MFDDLWVEFRVQSSGGIRVQSTMGTNKGAVQGSVEWGRTRVHWGAQGSVEWGRTRAQGKKNS